MLDDQLASQLGTHLSKLTHAVELVASLDDRPKSAELLELLEEIAALSDRVSVRTDGEADRRPSFAIVRVDSDVRVSFAGIPLGHEFTSLVLAILQVGGVAPKISDDTADLIRAIDRDLRFETFMSLSCQNCPDVVQALNAMSVINPRVQHVAIDGALFQDEVDERPDGVLVADQELLPASELAAAGGQVNAVLEAAGIRVVAVDTRETADATSASAFTGGIGIEVVTPSSSGVPRNELSLVIGGANATLYAEPPFEPSTRPPATPGSTTAPEPTAARDGQASDAAGGVPGGGGEVTVSPPTVGAGPADLPVPSVAPEADAGAPSVGEERMVVAGQVMTARTAYAGFAAWLLFTSLIPIGAAWWLQSRGGA